MGCSAWEDLWRGLTAFDQTTERTFGAALHDRSTAGSLNHPTCRCERPVEAGSVQTDWRALSAMFLVGLTGVVSLVVTLPAVYGLVS